jgi:hypothetical protein
MLKKSRVDGKSGRKKVGTRVATETSVSPWCVYLCLWLRHGGNAAADYPALRVSFNTSSSAPARW